MPKKEKLSVQLSIIVIGGRNNSLVHELRTMVTVELYVNVRYYAQQHPALESLYGKYEALIQKEAPTIICQDMVSASF